MKRLMGTILAALVVLTPGLASADLIYYLQPVAGSGYTITGNGSAASPYDVTVTSSATSGSINFTLYAAIDGTSTSSVAWGAGDYLWVSNAKASGTQLAGTFAPTGTAASLFGSPDSNFPQSTAVTLSANATNSASAFWSGGPINTANGLGTIGTGVDVSGSGDLADNYGSYIALGGPDSASANAGAVVEGAGAPHAGTYVDIPLGTLTYTYSSAVKSQNTQIDVHQVGGADGSWNGTYKDAAGLQLNVEASPDNPVTINYSPSGGTGDGSAIALTPSTLSLGRVLKGTTATAGTGTITDSAAANTGYTLGTASGNLTLSSAGGASLALNGSTTFTFGLTSTAAGTPGPVSDTINLTNTGNSSDSSNHAMTVSATVVQDRPMSVVGTLPSSGQRVLMGSVAALTLADTSYNSGGSALSDGLYTMPNVTKQGLPVSVGTGGMSLNAAATSVISASASTPSATINVSFPTAGSQSGGSVGLVAKSILSAETSLVGADTPAEVSVTVPAVTVVQSRPLTVTVSGAAIPSNVLQGSYYSATVSGSGLSDNLYTIPTMVALTPTISGAAITSTAGPLNNANTGSVVQLQYPTAGTFSTGGSIDLVAANIVNAEQGLFASGVSQTVVAGVTVPASVTVGNATAAVGYGAPLTGVGPASSLNLTVAASSLSSAVTSGGLHNNISQVSIYGQNMGSAASPVSMKWKPGGGASDTVNVSGVSGALAMQMQFDASLYGDSATTISNAVTKGNLFLGYLNAGTWTNPGTLAKYQGNETLATALGSATTLTSSLIGEWGYSYTSGGSGMLWAIMPAGSPASAGADFTAAVPEPATLALLAAGMAAGLVLIRRRRA